MTGGQSVAEIVNINGNCRGDRRLSGWVLFSDEKNDYEEIFVVVLKY